MFRRMVVSDRADMTPNDEALDGALAGGLAIPCSRALQALS
jgi:hypothetical protein